MDAEEDARYRVYEKVLNSFGTPLNEPAMRESDRKRLYPAVGHLYPVGTSMLVDVQDIDELADW